MYTIYTINLVSENCPKDMIASTCPLRKYVNDEKELFHVSVNETHLVPHGDRETFIQMYDKMHAICAQCKANNQKAK